jgi:hypothetical protein
VRVSLRLVPPETFSSELHDVHERRPGDRDSFNDEFRGASDSLIASDRPELVGGRGRGAVIAMAVTLMLPVLIGGGLALWYWSVPIGHWLAGTEPQDESTAEPEPEAAEPVAVTPTPDAPPQPAVEKVFGIRGTPDGSEPSPTTAPVQADPPLQPDASAGTIAAVSTTVRGNVGSTAVNAELDELDAALLACHAKAGASGSVELVLSFGITRDGNLQAISLGGGSEALHACVREALPTSGWPQPLDGGDGEASVSRTWKLGA